MCVFYDGSTPRLNQKCCFHIYQLYFQVADELVGKWGKMLEDPNIPLGQYTSLYALKILLHTLFGNLMKDDKEELKFRSETDEVRNSVPITDKFWKVGQNSKI